MRIVRISIQDFKSIKSLTIEPGALTVIHGPNGAGKTAVLEAVQCVFHGGHDPSVIRHGAKSAKITVETDCAVIEKTITAMQSKLGAVGPDGGKIREPKAYIEDLAASFGFDPIAFIAADKKKRAEYLAKNMRMDLRAKEVLERWPESVHTANAGDVPHLPNKEYREYWLRQTVDWKGAYDLEGWGLLETTFYDRRRSANVQAEQLSATVDQLRGSCSDPDETDWPAKRREAESEVARLESELADAKATFQGRVDVNLAEIDTWLAREIAQATAEAEERRAAIRQQGAAILAENEPGFRAQIDTAKAEAATLEQRAKEYQKAAGVRAQLKQFEKQYSDVRAEAAKLDACVAAIRDVRAAKLEESPIPGLSVREGEVYYEIDTGIVPFDRLNTAKQYELAMAIAVLGERKLPFMVCDRAESLDGEKWDEFCGAVKASGMQVIVARVDEAEGLTVTTE